jgi:hypothetical protein
MYLVYIPIRYYQEAGEISWDQPMLGEKFNKKLFLQPIYFASVLFGIFKISFITFILSGFISSNLKSDDSWLSNLLPIYLTKYQETQTFLYSGIYIFIHFLLHMFILQFSYFFILRSINYCDFFSLSLLYVRFS